MIKHCKSFVSNSGHIRHVDGRTGSLQKLELIPGKTNHLMKDINSYRQNCHFTGKNCHMQNQFYLLLLMVKLAKTI